MREQSIRRIVVMGGFHLPVPGDLDNVGRKLIVPIIKLMGIVVEDTTAMSALVQASELDWTLVRAPRVVDRQRPTTTRTGTLKLGCRCLPLLASAACRDPASGRASSARKGGKGRTPAFRAWQGRGLIPQPLAVKGGYTVAALHGCTAIGP